MENWSREKVNLGRAPLLPRNDKSATILNSKQRAHLVEQAAIEPLWILDSRVATEFSPSYVSLTSHVSGNLATHSSASRPNPLLSIKIHKEDRIPSYLVVI
ncbi:uncharacterized protein LOC135196044 [Macrobrachium nipponense]|uniref:uncharacterized protein LOC135196044 n=1 Tax=Macrobrachium nipponense TaxID=159736 RepID=UPI0030C866A9